MGILIHIKPRGMIMLDSTLLRTRTGTVLLAVSLLSATTIAQDHGEYNWSIMGPIEPERYICYRTADAPVIDGRLDDLCWRQTNWNAPLADIMGQDKPHARFRTLVKMRWDTTNLYLAAELEEPHVWANLTERDSVIFRNNDFEFMIDPDGNGHDYCEVEINALNTVWDLFLHHPYRDGRGAADTSWNIEGMRTAVAVNGTLNDPSDLDIGWTIEIAIPWEALANTGTFSIPRQGDQWRMNFYRAQWNHTVENGVYQRVASEYASSWVWSPIGVNMVHCPEKWGYVQFSELTPGADRFIPDPTAEARLALYTVFYAQREYNIANGSFAGSLEDLMLHFPGGAPVTGLPVLELTEDGYRTSIDVLLADGSIERLILTQAGDIVRGDDTR